MSTIYPLNDCWQFADASENVFRSIAVPGDINDALHKHGILPDPHIGLQFRKYFPNSAKAWTYRREFDKPIFKENCELVFEGITGAAEIYLNGEKLGEARNAHRPHRFEIGGKLKEKNNLEIRFEPIEKTLGKPRMNAYGWGNERTFLRTPPFNYGWDWSVAVPSTGLSGDVYLDCDNAVRIVNVNYRTPKLGRVDFFVESSHAARELGYKIRIRVFGHGADVSEELSSSLDMDKLQGAIEEPNKLSQHRVFTSLEIPNAKYWQSNGTGEAALYNYEVELVIDNVVVDSKKGRLGFRTVRVVENPFRKESGHGFSYEIELNGQSIFIRGANWVPVELWPAVATESQYRRLLEMAKNANFNMLRIWGGGIYEREIFYDLCDEYGIMVWQDFMFASNSYPVGLLREEIKMEAEYQLKRLRLHTCIAHWCGINEDVFSWAFPGCGRLKDVVQADYGDYTGNANWAFHDDPEIFSMILRGLTSQLGNGVPYTESSPQSHGDCGNMPQSGNCHYTCSFYLREHPESFREHFAQVSSFNSEFAHQAPDTALNTRKFLGLGDGPVAWPPEDQELWEAHIQRGHGEPLWSRQTDVASKIIGKVDSFETFIRNAQISQFELVRCEFEHYRASRPDCGGTMFWMFNDCWPTGSWSLVNYYGQLKVAYYAAKRYCAPEIPVVISLTGKMRFGFDNATFEPRELHYTYGLATLDGTVKWVKEGRATAPANQFTLLDVCNLADDKRSLGDHYFITIDGFDTARCFPDGWLGVQWPESEGKIEQIAPGRVRLTVTKGFMRMAHLACKEPGKHADFSDNFFDMATGETRDITTAVPAADLRLLNWNTEWE